VCLCVCPPSGGQNLELLESFGRSTAEHVEACRANPHRQAYANIMIEKDQVWLWCVCVGGGGVLGLLSREGELVTAE
jgi:hypothetical protein